MIRMIQSTSAKSAKDYFTEALNKSDYYLNDQELAGQFHGKLAARIGLDNIASKEVFQALCENTNPFTGERLTARTTRNRTVGYDINFHCPKSVSILHVLAKDNHILDAFKASVEEIMREIERDSKTRKRKKGSNEERYSGELVWANFIHQTSRPVQGNAPDPHLHSHCFTFNMTWDNVEKRYKACQFRNIKRDMPYYQAKFQKLLSDKLFALGYGIVKTKTAFEVQNVPEEALKHFSKRTNEIGLIAKHNNITDAKELDKLGSRTRVSKQKGLTMVQLKKEWIKQIKTLKPFQDGKKDLVIRNTGKPKPPKEKPDRFIDMALADSFEKCSVIQDRRVLEKAFRFATARNVEATKIQVQFASHPQIIKAFDGNQTLCTTKSVLAEERKLLELVAKHSITQNPLYSQVPETALSTEQKEVMNQVLTTSDQFFIIQGRAGTGKTSLTKETIRLIEAVGKSVTIVAPTSQASRGVLKDEGFEKADTVAKLLVDEKVQNSLKDQVLWVDEAGLLGNREMLAIINLVVKQNARLILSGDTKQHSPVARGDSLRLLQDLTKIKTATLETIYRQKNAVYRHAVNQISRDDIHGAFRTLEQIGSFKEVGQTGKFNGIAKDFVASLQKGKEALLICPTNKEADSITFSIRQELKEAGLLGKKEMTYSTLINLNYSISEKKDHSNFMPKQVIQFNQNEKGFARGSVWFVKKVHKDKLDIYDAAGRFRQIPLQGHYNFDVYSQGQINLAKNDLVRITRNAFDLKGKRLNNGQDLEFKSFDNRGSLLFVNKKSKCEYVVSSEFGHLKHAYCNTSYASQGKTVDEVFIYQASETFPATDRKKFYV